MSEKLKRRSLARYLFFPLIFIALLLVAAKLVALQRTELIARLSNRIAHAETSQAQAAVRQLAAMPEPPMDELVEAAASPNREIAKEAQHAIGEVLRRVQREIEVDRAPRRSARQLASLADSLMDHLNDFPGVDHNWLAQTTRRVIMLSNRLPVETTPLVASQCDTVLATIADTAIAKVAYETALDASIDFNQTSSNSVSPRNLDSNHSSQTRLGERFASFPSRAYSGMDANHADPSPHMREAMLTPVSEQRSGSNESETFDSNPSPWQAGWTHPMFYPMPTLPIEAIPLPTHGTSNVSNPLRSGITGARRSLGGNEIELSQVSSRELLAQWLEAEGAEHPPLEEELARRGLKRLSRPMVELYFSADVEDRLHLIDRVLADPGIDARPWVMLLADDPHGDVRLMIVTLMATSNDPVLIDKAWDVVIHDRDPRVAQLAERLRERRTSRQSF